MEEVSHYPEEYFGLPNERRFPIYTLEETILSAEMLLECEDPKRKILGKNIQKRFNELNYPIKPLGKLIYYLKPSLEADANMIEASNFGTLEPIVGAQPTVLKQEIYDNDDESLVELFDSDRLKLVINKESSLYYLEADDCCKSKLEKRLFNLGETCEKSERLLNKIRAGVNYNLQIKSPEWRFLQFLHAFSHGNTSNSVDAMINHCINIAYDGKYSFSELMQFCLRVVDTQPDNGKRDYIVKTIQSKLSNLTNSKSNSTINFLHTESFNNKPYTYTKFLGNKLPTKEELVDLLGDKITESFYVSESDSKLTKVIELIRSIKVDKDGNITIDLRDKLTFDHYNEVHRVGIAYRDANNIEGLKDICAYGFSIIATIEADYTRKRGVDKNSQIYKDMMRLRALWINDFKMFIAIIQKVEPGFDFMKYYKETGYDKKIFIISKDAIKFLIQVFRTIMKF